MAITPVHMVTALEGRTESVSSIGSRRYGTKCQTFTNNETLNFIKGKESNAGKVAYTCIRLCNSPGTCHYQACAYYVSALTALLPGVECVATRMLCNMGYRVREINERDFVEVGFVLDPSVDSLHIYVMIGQLIFLLYMNISEDSYDSCMQERSNAMKDLVGLFGAPEVVISYSQASKLRQTLGSQHELKKEVLLSMLDLQNGEGPVRRMFAYICGNLNWNGMSEIMCVIQVLFQTKSPVLGNAAVREEVKNLYAAYQEIKKIEYPQYFCILVPYKLTRVVESSMFPILSNVAHIVRGDQYSNVPRAGLREAVNMAFVKLLVSEHRSYVKNSGRSGDASIVEFA